MERLVVFLDNEIYGGSERLMYTVLTSKLIRENYIVNALYGYNKPMHDGLVREKAILCKALKEIFGEITRLEV